MGSVSVLYPSDVFCLCLLRFGVSSPRHKCPFGTSLRRTSRTKETEPRPKGMRRARSYLSLLFWRVSLVQCRRPSASLAWCSFFVLVRGVCRNETRVLSSKLGVRRGVPSTPSTQKFFILSDEFQWSFVVTLYSCPHTPNVRSETDIPKSPPPHIDPSASCPVFDPGKTQSDPEGTCLRV